MPKLHRALLVLEDDLRKVTERGGHDRGLEKTAQQKGIIGDIPVHEHIGHPDGIHHLETRIIRIEGDVVDSISLHHVDQRSGVGEADGHVGLHRTVFICALRSGPCATRRQVQSGLKEADKRVRGQGIKNVDQKKRRNR